VRDKGYYFFRPEYIEYLADSIAVKGKINMKIIKASNVPNMALMRYVTRDVIARVSSNRGGGTPDTLITPRCTLIKMIPVHINDSVIAGCIRSRKGRPFRVSNMDRTQLYLSRLGIFSSIDMNVRPVDSVTANGDGMLDVMLNCTLDKPLEVKTELQGTSKSNSFIGPGLSLGVTHKNLFGGGEQLTTNLSASYEWQTGKGSSDNKKDINSYEFGLDVALAIPRLLAPKFIDRSRRYLNWTRISFNGDIMNRPSYFKMAQIGTKFSWEWHANRHSLNEFTPFKLTYNKLISRTASFDSAMIANPAIALSFKNTFIPEMMYTYTYDNAFGNNNLTWTYTIIEAGNAFSGIWGLCGGNNGTKKLFGTAFSQFIKAQTQIVINHKWLADCHLVGRFFIGAAHAYGNSSQVPYSEQFYVGGANSLRAFTVRTIGPGSYRAKSGDVNGFYDQTGTFKLEMNCEYRFPIFSYFKGAFFVDAGNVWLLKNDDMRPGGQLKMNKFFDQLAVGTGAGVRFDMQMLVIRADMGVGIHAPYDTGKSGYYNIKKFKDGLAFHIAIGYPF
jgi:outer membrane protein assembly factor BamA